MKVGMRNFPGHIYFAHIPFLKNLCWNSENFNKVIVGIDDLIRSANLNTTALINKTRKNKRKKIKIQHVKVTENQRWKTEQLTVLRLWSEDSEIPT